MAKSKPRYKKQKRVKQLANARLMRKTKWLQSKSPDVWCINKYSKMKSIFSQKRNHSRALILDIDGTVCEFMTGQRKHQKVKFRPHFADFVSETRQFADLFIFSSMDILRLNNLWKKYFPKILVDVLTKACWWGIKRTSLLFWQFLRMFFWLTTAQSMFTPDPYNIIFP